MRRISAKRMLFLICCNSIAANLAHPVEPMFLQGLHFHDYMFGVAFACMAFTNFLFSPFWGKIADRFGYVKNSCFCYLGYAVAQLLFGMAKSEVTIALARLLAGFFISGIMVIQLLYIMHASKEEERSKHLAIASSIMLAAAPFGYLIGGFLGDVSVALTFVIQAASLATIGILHPVLLKEPDEQTRVSAYKSANPFAAFAEAKKDMTVLILIFLLVTLFTTFASTAYDNCFNYYIRDQYGFPSSYNGILKAAVGFLTILANGTITVYLIRRADINRTIIWVLSVCAMMMGGICVLKSMIPFIALNIVFFGFNAVYQPLLQAKLSSFPLEKQGTIVGVFNSTKALGSVFGSLAAGFAYEIDPRFAFVIALVCFVAAVVASCVNIREIRKEKEGVSA